jgi:hypothetical protein
MRRNNSLDFTEMYRLTKFVESVREPFANWQKAIKAAEQHMDRKISQSNLETAMKSCGMAIETFVQRTHIESPLGKVAARVRELEQRVAELEKLVGSCAK